MEQNCIPVDMAENKRRPEETVFEYTQRIRQSVVEKFTEHGIPTDVKEAGALASFLNDMDRQEEVKHRIATEEKAVESDKAATALIGAMLSKLGNINPYALPEPTGEIVDHDVELPKVELVPGELDHNPQVMNYESFMSEYRAKHPKHLDDD